MSGVAVSAHNEDGQPGRSRSDLNQTGDILTDANIEDNGTYNYF